VSSNVLVDDVRLVEHQVAVDQHRHAVVRIDDGDVFGLVEEIDVDHLEVHLLLVEDDAAAMAERARGARVQVHHGAGAPGIVCITHHFADGWRVHFSMPHGLHSRIRELMDVFPVLAFQRVGKDKEDCKENQHDHAQLLAELAHRLAHVLQEGHQVADHCVVFLRLHLARLGQRQLVVGAHHLLALQFPEHVRHADVFEDHVVPAGRAALVAIEGAQIGVQPVGAAAVLGGAGPGDHGQIRRRRAEPGLGLGALHGDLHRLADLLGGEHQVVLDLRVAQADVPQAVVAHVGRRMAVQAVIDENLGAVLQGGHVIGLVRRGQDAGWGPRQTPGPARTGLR
jgi:hypothetical protein